MLKKYKIVVTGGSGRFGKKLKEFNPGNYVFPNKKEFDVLNFKKIIKYLRKIKPKILVHLAGLSRPMAEHENNISKSIKLNIIGTSNVTLACKELGIKIIYFSTSYVYPGKKGEYKESDPVLPCNNYAWSKLGGEAAVQMCKNSLILRVCMTEKPFVHKSAYANMITNFIFHEELIPIFKKITKYKGIINIGGPSQSVYNFAKKYNPNVKKIYIKKNNNLMPMNSSMNLSKLKKIIK